MHFTVRSEDGVRGLGHVTSCVLQMAPSQLPWRFQSSCHHIWRHGGVKWRSFSCFVDVSLPGITCDVMCGVRWRLQLLWQCQSSWHHVWHHTWHQVAPSVDMAVSASLASYVTSCILWGAPSQLPWRCQSSWHHVWHHAWRQVAPSDDKLMSVFLASHVASCVASSGALSCYGNVSLPGITCDVMCLVRWRPFNYYGNVSLPGITCGVMCGVKWRPQLLRPSSVFLASSVASCVASSGSVSWYGNVSLPGIICGVKWRPQLLWQWQSSLHHMLRPGWRQVAPSDVKLMSVFLASHVASCVASSGALSVSPLKALKRSFDQSSEKLCRLLFSINLSLRLRQRRRGVSLLN